MGGGDLIKGEAGEQLGSFGQVLTAGFDARNVGFASGGEGEGCGAGGFKLLLFGTVFGALGRYFFDFAGGVGNMLAQLCYFVFKSVGEGEGTGVCALGALCHALGVSSRSVGVLPGADGALVQVLSAGEGCLCCCVFRFDAHHNGVGFLAGFFCLRVGITRSSQLGL